MAEGERQERESEERREESDGQVKRERKKRREERKRGKRVHRAGFEIDYSQQCSLLHMAFYFYVLCGVSQGPT
jgi:hypothetical protein